MGIKEFWNSLWPINKLLLVILLGIISSIPFIGAGSYEKTMYVVSVETIDPVLGWEHTIVTYSNIQPNAVTELGSYSEVFYGTDHQFEPGNYYRVKYHRPIGHLYPIVDEITLDTHEKRSTQ